MKLLRRFWSVLLNLFLLILPLILLIVSGYYYGQPVAERFKDFLGNPVTEFIAISDHFEQQSFSPRLYKNSNQILHKLSARDKIDENSKQQLRSALFTIHRATVKNVPIDSENTEDTGFFSQYKQLLSNPQLKRVFPHPERLTTLLLKDIQRVKKLDNLPFHPAEGIEAYIGPAGLVGETIRDYGQIYGDQYTCQNIYKTECSEIYAPAVEISSRWISQYLQTWPELGDRGRLGLTIFVEQLDKLVEVYSKLNSNIENYLEVAPWNKHKQFLETYDNFQDNFKKDLHRWYSRAVQNVLYQTEKFNSIPPDRINNELAALRTVENKIQNSQAVRPLLITENTGAIRQQAKNHLIQLYHELTAAEKFKSDFKLVEQKIQDLKLTLEAFPGGSQQIKEQQNLLENISETYAQLNSSLENKNYSDLRQLLDRVDEKIESANFSGWKIMIKSFINNSLARLSSPDFQPVDREGQQIYTEIVNKIEEINQIIELDKISEKWKNNTLLALRSQRFSRLKFEIIKLLQSPGPGDIEPVISRLEELTTLSELPEELAGQPEKIAFYSALIEKITLDSEKIYDNFQSNINLFQRQKNNFDRLTEIINTLSVPRRKLLLETNLKQLSNRIHSWLNNFQNNDKLLQLLYSHLLTEMEDTYNKLTATAIDWTVQTKEDARPAEELISIHKNLKNGLEKARDIEGFTATYEPQPWLELLSFRRQLTEIRQAIGALERGGLFGDNQPYQDFISLVGDTNYQSFPEKYQYENEQKLTGLLQKEILDKTKEINKISSGDWLSGWGGRIRGNDILEPWIGFLKTIAQQIDSKPFSRQLNNHIEDSQRLKQQLEEE
ncbi:MAG: hypothetical protein ACQEP7_00430 [bacterium]